MSDTSTDTEPQEGGLHQLREAARKGEAALKENDLLKRQLAFAQAGVDITTKVGGMFFKTFEGDTSDLAAIKAEALEVGAIKVEAPAVDEGRADEDARRTGAQTAFSSGSNGTPAPQEGPRPQDAALEKYQQDIRAGVDEVDAGDDAMAFLIGSAMKGDGRAFINQSAHNAAGREADRRANMGR